MSLALMLMYRNEEIFYALITSNIVPLKKVNIDETKIQTFTEKNFMDIVKFLSSYNKNYFPYSLKSSKGIAVVKKRVNTNEVTEVLE